RGRRGGRGRCRGGGGCGRGRRTQHAHRDRDRSTLARTRTGRRALGQHHPDLRRFGGRGRGRLRREARPPRRGGPPPGGGRPPCVSLCPPTLGTAASFGACATTRFTSPPARSDEPAGGDCESTVSGACVVEACWVTVPTVSP